MDYQDAVLAIGAATSFGELYEAIRVAVLAILQEASEAVVFLTSCTIAENFAFGECVTPRGIGLSDNSRLSAIVSGNQVNNDISGLIDTSEYFTLTNSQSNLSISSDSNSNDFKVLLWPVANADNTLLSLILVKYASSHAVSRDEMLGFYLLGKQITITVKRLRKTLQQSKRRISSAATLEKAAAVTMGNRLHAHSRSHSHSHSHSHGRANSNSNSNSRSHGNAHGTTKKPLPDDFHPVSKPESNNSAPGNSISAIMKLCSELNDRDGTALQLKLVKFLKERTSADIVLLLLIAQDSTEMFCQLVDEVVLEQEMTLAAHNNVFARMITANEHLRLSDLSNDELECVATMLRDNLHEFNGPISTFLSIPITRRSTTDKLAIVCLINKMPAPSEFTQADIDAVSECFLYTASVLTSTIAFQIERRLKMQTETLLQVAKNIFRKLDNLSTLLREIMAEAKALARAERCSVFLLEKERNQLVANVFDGLPSNTLLTEIRIPATQGIAGYVATTGHLLNIHDAYAHPLFYRGVDEETGFRTRNILCFPIKDDNGEIIGVAQLCNKLNAPHFSRFDEEIAKTFSVYCCISIVHCLMYKQLQEAQVRYQLANELMNYHMQIADMQVEQLAVSDIREPAYFMPDFNSLNSIPREIPEMQTTEAVMTMFDQLGFIRRWRMSKRTVSKFVLMVKRGYRDPPYHNWYHAFSVCHFVYTMIKNCALDTLLQDIELLGLFVAAICHDVDHRGTNNSFQVESKSTLAALYSSEGSVLERHHFAQTLCIVNAYGCNIFENMDSEQYSRILDLIRDIILATDLGRHFKIVKQQSEMVENGYNSADEKHRSLLLYMLMTAADLNDSAKTWRNARNSANLICQEFFHQGDMERQIGRQPLEMMDRQRANIPELQIGFLQHVAFGVFRNLSVLFIPMIPMVENINKNIEIWKIKKDKVQAGEIQGNSIEDMFFRDVVPEDLDRPR